MLDARWDAPRWLIRWEEPMVVALCAIALAGIAPSLGHIGLSWDALNHHIYLGWIADKPRFDRDYLAASYQAFQYPYLYWPVYKLAAAGASGAVAGVVLALLHVTAAPACWRLVHACIPGREWFHVAMRLLGVALAFLSGVVLSMFDSTGNDLLAAIPVVWAVAIALAPVAAHAEAGAGLRRSVWVSGLLAGVSVAFKFSNGPIVILLPVLWLWPRQSMGSRLRLLVQGGAWALLGFVAAYAAWGWQLWVHFGNPVYPFFDGGFEQLRNLSGWVRDSF